MIFNVLQNITNVNTPAAFKDIRRVLTKEGGPIVLSSFVAIFSLFLATSCVPQRSILPEPVSAVKTAAAEAFYEKENQERDANWKNNYVQIVGEDVLLHLS